MNNNKLHKNSAIFIAAVLVAGVVAIASPFTAYAQEYQQEYQQDYKSYDPYKQSEKEDDSKSVSKIQKAKCYQANGNKNDLTQRQGQEQFTSTETENNAGRALAAAPSEALTPEEALSQMTGNGDRRGDHQLGNADIVNLCFNKNINPIDVEFEPGQIQFGAAGEVG